MKKYFYKKEYSQIKFIFILVLGILLLSPMIMFAAEGAFVPLTDGGVPGITAGVETRDFLNIMFDIGLAITATLAVVMMTIGGLQYMTTDSVFNKTEGKDKIQNALIGLLIALLIWLILFTINPNLLNFNTGLNLDTSKIDSEFNLESLRKNSGGNSLSEAEKKTSGSETKRNCESMKDAVAVEC